MSLSDVLWVDYETASELDLKKVGADRYSRHSSTRALMLGWAVNDGPAYVWDIDAGEPMPSEIEPFLVHQRGTIRAHNAPFEMMITDQVLSRTMPQTMFIPPTVPGQWRCSQVMAFGLSFVRGLGEMVQQIGLPSNVEKDARGRRLIHIFCKRQPKTHHVQWHNRDTKQDEWNEFLEYCRQDIEAMRALWKWCEQFDPISDEEWVNWSLDRRINQAGIPVDMVLVDLALTAMATAKRSLEAELYQITGLTKITPRPLREWLETQLLFQGLAMPNLQKATKEWTVERCEGPAKAALEASILIAQASSSSKWNAFKQRTDPGTNLLRETLQFAGAQRTRRWCLTADTLIPVLDKDNQQLDKHIVDVLNSDLVWDGLEYVAHEGVVFSGYNEVIEYDGIRGTPDHKIFTEQGDTISLLEARERGVKIKTASRAPFNGVDST